MQFPRLTLARRFALLLGLLGFSAAQAADEFLPATEAFKYETRASETGLTVQYRVHPGYYLYRDRLAFESATPGVTVGPPQFPAGEDHEDEYFGRQVIYRDTVDIPVPVSFEGAPRAFDLRLKLQGCADAGLCYPPLTWTTTVEAPTAPAASGGGFSLKRMLGGGGTPKDGTFLPMDEAFILSTSSSSPDRVTLRWDVADGYYLYRDKVKVTVADGTATLGAPQMPEGKLHVDEYFGEQVVYYGELVMNVPVAAAAGTREIALDVAYMGCADAGLCYPPTVKRVTVALGAAPATAAAGTPSRGRGTHGVRAGRPRPKDPQRQPARGARDLLRRRTAARLHALRAADGADPLRHHRRRRPRPAGLPRTRLLPVARLRARHGAHLHRRRRGVRRRRASRRRRSSRSRGSSWCSRACSCCSRSRCSACSTCRCRPPCRPASPTRATSRSRARCSARP